MKPDLSTLAKRFAAWLELAYGTAPSLVLATENEISQRTIQNWKAGITEPGADALRTLHRMGCNIMWLVTGEGDTWFADTVKGRLFAEKHESNKGVVKEPGASARKDVGVKPEPPVRIVPEQVINARFYNLEDIPDLPVREQSPETAALLIAKRMEILAEKRAKLDAEYTTVRDRLEEESRSDLHRLVEVITKS